jgi:SAM-dependent methyltransferase
VHNNSRLLFERYALSAFRPGARVLEIGPASFPSEYANLVEGWSRWDTVDIHQEPRLTFRALSEYEFPIAAGTYDVVFSAQVLEHVRKIWVWMKEVARVCAPGGSVITIVPVSWPYHEAPIDCWRVYSEGLRTLFEDAHLEPALVKTESLEGAPFARAFPGPGMDHQSRIKKLYSRLLGPMGFPVQTSLDTIGIARKSAA